MAGHNKNGLAIRMASFLPVWRKDPVAYCRDVLGVTLWSKQAEVLQSLTVHRRTAVQSGHAVGKTFVAACALLWFLTCYQPSKVVSTATTFAQVKHRLWREVRRLYFGAKIPMGGDMLDTQLRMNREGWEAIGVSTNHPDDFQGAHEENILLIFDEAQGIEGEIWEGAESMMGSRNSRWLVIANPIYSSGDFYDACHDPQNWHRIQISCLDHPNMTAAPGEEPVPAAVTREWVEGRRRQWGDKSPYWQCRVAGEFPEVGDDNVITIGLLERNADRRVEGYNERHMGVDIARFGQDRSVAYLVENRVVKDVFEWSFASTMESVGRIIHLMSRWSVQPPNVHVDVIGVGGGVVDRLVEQGFYVDSVNAAEIASEDWVDLIGEEVAFANRRAELYWTCRALLESKQLVIPRKFTQLWRELLQPRYSFDSSGRIKIEPKDKIRERCGASPDHADALILSLSRTASVREPWVMVI